MTNKQAAVDDNGRTEAPMSQLLVDVPTASNALSISRSTVYELMASGELGSVSIGKSRRIPVDELERFVARLKGEQDEAPQPVG